MRHRAARDSFDPLVPLSWSDALILPRGEWVMGVERGVDLESGNVSRKPDVMHTGQAEGLKERCCDFGQEQRRSRTPGTGGSIA